jgi:hypothetical protein
MICDVETSRTREGSSRGREGALRGDEAIMNGFETNSEASA